jgi:hypothetical protein
MTQLLHIIFEIDENKNRRIVHVGLDKDTVRSASRQDQATDKVRLYMAIDVDELNQLISANREAVIADAVTLIP